MSYITYGKTAVKGTPNPGVKLNLPTLKPDKQYVPKQFKDISDQKVVNGRNLPAGGIAYATRKTESVISKPPIKTEKIIIKRVKKK